MKGFQQCWGESTKENLQNNKWRSAALLLKGWEKNHITIAVFEADGPRNYQGKWSLCGTFNVKIKRC